MAAIASARTISVSAGTSDVSSDTDSIKSSSADSDSDSLDSEDMNLDSMSASQFLILPNDMLQLEPILSEDEEDNDPTPTSSIHLSVSTMPSILRHPLELSVPTITVISPETEVSYARDSYSPSAMSHLLPVHLSEVQFVTVIEGDPLVVIEELTDYLWIVKVCRTDSIGIIPAWNVEGELERIARFNMEVNGRVSSPVVEFASPGESPSPSEGGSSAGSPPTTPSSTTDDPSPFLEDSVYVADQSYYHARKVRKVHGVKCVGFVSARPQVVFRYPSEACIHGEWDNSSRVDSEDQDATSVIWIHGWLEGDEDESAIEDSTIGCEESSGMKRKTRRGRRRSRKRQPLSQ